MRKSIGVIITLIIICAASLGAYSYGSNKGYSEGYHNGHDVGYADARKDYVPPRTYLFEYNDLQDKYNTLVNDYNSLSKYASTPQYQPRQPLNCTSSALGSSTYTNCY